MTKIIGLTGGIGSGKSTVARLFMKMGAPVYFADDAGREVMEDPSIIEKIVSAFGVKILHNNQIDRKALSAIVFNNPEQLQLLNSIVHPAVGIHFKEWLLKHKSSPFIIKEAAILFESGTYLKCDAIISVVAPEETRIRRVMARDSISEEDVNARINNQWTDEQRIKNSTYVIYNTTLEALQTQTIEIYNKLIGSY